MCRGPGMVCLCGLFAISWFLSFRGTNATRNLHSYDFGQTADSSLRSKWQFRKIKLLLIRFRLFRLAHVVGRVHAPQHVVREEELAVGWHHHDLQLVGKPLGD